MIAGNKVSHINGEQGFGNGLSANGTVLKLRLDTAAASLTLFVNGQSQGVCNPTALNPPSTDKRLCVCMCVALYAHCVGPLVVEQDMFSDIRVPVKAFVCLTQEQRVVLRFPQSSNS